MKKRMYFAVCSLVGLILVVFLYEFLWSMKFPEIPEFSAEGGFYADTLELELTAESGSTIYYTLDSSTPTTDSLVYQGRIILEDRSAEENQYRDIQNVVTDWEEYCPDGVTVPKATVVRAIAVSPWGESSEVVTQTYFVGIECPEDAVVFSLVSDPDNLFGDNGIYVTGAEYDDWYVNRRYEQTQPVPNFNKSLEVPGNLEMFVNGQGGLNQAVGVRIQGASDRADADKRFSIFAREEYGTGEVFDEEIYEDILTHSVMLKFYFLDAMMDEVLYDRDVSTQQSKRVCLYLDGEYWYDSYILERYDQQYFTAHYGVRDINMIKNGQLQHGTEMPGQETYAQFMEWLQVTDFSSEENWNLLNEKIDVQSYIDFMCANIYICNVDFSENKNYLLWKTTTDEGTEYGDGRWRWIMYDVDAIAYAGAYFNAPSIPGINNIADDLPFTGGVNTNENVLYKACFQNAEFRKQFVLSFLDMANVNFNAERMEQILEEYNVPITVYGNFFTERFDYITTYLAEEFGLEGNLEEVVLETQPEQGTIRINTSVPDLSQGKWSGRYFADYPVTVTALPQEGYEFVKWEGTVESTEPSLTISVEGGLELRAIFQPIK